MKKKPSKIQNALGGQSNYYEPSKINVFKEKMTGAGRAKKSRATKKNALHKIHAALGMAEKTSTRKLLEIAAARLAGIGEGNPVADFEFAVSSYLKRLSRETGNTIPVENYWDQLLDLVKEADPALAKTFANDFKNHFQWCLVGHVHRLSMEHDQSPSSIQEFVVFRKGKKRTVVARLRDGTMIPVQDGGGRRIDPCVIFAGMEERPALALRDFKRFLQMDSKRAIELLESDKFKFSFHIQKHPPRAHIRAVNRFSLASHSRTENQVAESPQSNIRQKSQSLPCSHQTISALGSPQRLPARHATFMRS